MFWAVYVFHCYSADFNVTEGSESGRATSAWLAMNEELISAAAWSV